VNQNDDDCAGQATWGEQFSSGGWGENSGGGPDVERPYFFSAVFGGEFNAAQTDIEEGEFFLGLAPENDTNVANGATDFIGFRARDVTDDATKKIYFVSGRAGGASGQLVDELVVDTGWTKANTGQTQDQNRANKILGPHDYAKFSMYVQPGPGNVGGQAWAYLNGVGIPANPITLTHDAGASQSHPDARLAVTILCKNGSAVEGAICEFHDLVNARRHTRPDGSLYGP
jgi:hypothetical protein